MFCHNCGSKLLDDACFCSNCGAKVMSSPNPENSTQTRNTTQSTPAAATLQSAQTDVSVSASPAPATPKKPVTAVNPQAPFSIWDYILTFFTGNAPFSNNRVLNAIKRIAVSPISLLAAITYTLAVILNLIDISYISIALNDALDEVLSQFNSSFFLYNTPEILEQSMDILTASTTFFAFLTMLPQIAIASGIWITVVSAFNKTSDTLSIVGLRIIRIVNTISVVLSVISTALVAVFCVAVHLFIYNNHIPFRYSFVLYLAMAIGLAILGLVIYLRLKISDMLDCLMYSIDRKYPIKLSSLIAILCLISAIITFTFGLATNSLTSVTLCNSISLLCFAILIYMFKNAMNIQRKISLSENSQETSSASTSSLQEPDYEVVKNPTYGVPSTAKKVALFSAAGIALIAVIVVIINIINSSVVDKEIVGKWSLVSDSESITEFSKNGDFYSTDGSVYEEFGTCYTEDGVIYITIDGQTTEMKYTVIDDDHIRIQHEYRDYYGWQNKWFDYYRVD